MTHLHLHTSYGFSWHNDVSERLFVQGYCFDEQGYYYEGAELLEYFSGIGSAEGFVRRITEANGCFAVIWKAEDATFAAVDRLRSLPIVWKKASDGIHISGDVSQLGDSHTLDTAQAVVFPYSCLSLGAATLFREVHQLQAGEWLHIQGRTTTVRTYFACTNEFDPSSPSEEEIRRQFRLTAEAVWTRLIQASRQRTFVIPLSGGYDSRLIAAMFRQLECERVICFTYGRKSSNEVAISRQVAEKLGYPWHFVEYTESLLKTYLEEDGLAYRDFASNGISVAHEQDFFAIRQLLLEGKIPVDAIVLPGFGGDVLAGSWFPDKVPASWSRDRFIRYLITNRKFFSGTRKPRLDKKAIYQMISKEIPVEAIPDLPTAYSLLQYWGMRNRMSKFLVNAVRVYDFWGLHWKLPFFDHEWIDYWRGIPDVYKLNKRLYLSEASQWLFQPMGIDFHMDVPRPSVFRKFAKQLLPAVIVDELKARWVDRVPVDVNNQDTLSRLICEEQGWDEERLKRVDLNYLMGSAYIRKLTDAFGL
ncbi:MAG: asparagine synthase C-terminal domain-containing protein [Bacteroidota bacterium]